MIKPIQDNREKVRIADQRVWSRRTGSNHEGPLIRDDLVARVRIEIKSGRYESPERLECAVRVLLAAMTGEKSAASAVGRTPLEIRKNRVF